MHPWPSCHRQCVMMPPLTQRRVMMKANLNLMSDCRLMMRNVCVKGTPLPAVACVNNVRARDKLQTCKTQVCHHDTIDM